MSTLLFLLVIFFQSPGSFGDEDLDTASAEALHKTQRLLKDPAERKKAAAENKQAAWMDQQVQSLGGSEENTQQIYELAAEIFGNLTKETGGDPNKMMELLMKAKSNPEAFSKKLTPAQLEKLKAISGRLPVSTGGSKKAP